MKLSVNIRNRSIFGLLILMVMSCLAACSTSKSEATEENKEGSVVTEWLIKAQAASQRMNKYGFEIQLNQKISEEGQKDPSLVKIGMLGRAERNPLKLDQTVTSNIDGEESTLRAIILPDAYYMYLPEYEEWSRLGKDVAAENIATLSDFQVNPEHAMQNIQALGQALTAEQNDKAVTVRYDGAGPEASLFLASLMGSTLGLTGTESEIASSLEVQKLKVILTLDVKQHWPLSYRIESDMTIALEPGSKSVINQTLSGTYSKHNVAAAVTVPKEAQKALDPDQLDDLLKSE